jgi:Ala-tRNA(Pro) deacylase
MASRTRLKTFLDQERVSYHDIPHETEYTSQETAEGTHTPGHKFAKTLVVRLDGRFAVVVLPAHHRLDLDKLRSALGAPDAELAKEDEMKRLFPDAEVGAEPPFGNLYGLPVLVSSALAAEDWITMNAGTHQDALRMKVADFLRLVQPSILALS